MMNDARIITISHLLTHSLPLYLAPPRLDSRHTHIHGEVRFHLNQERMRGEKEAQVRSCLQVCCPLLTPPLFYL
jgi:hypothetical protein